MNRQDRIQLLLAHHSFFEPFTGPFDHELLEETFQSQAGLKTAVLPKKILHLISGNTPHALHQSLLTGILLGAKNLLKLPSNALLDFNAPEPLRGHLEIARELPEKWEREADTWVVFGSDQTIRHFQNRCPLNVPFVSHGHRFGVALIDEASPDAAALAARDIGLYNQNGCLSLQTIFLSDPRSFGPTLACAMADFEKEHPRGPLSASEAGAITNLRQETRYLAALDPDSYGIWESPGSTAWTIIFHDDPALRPSPGNRTVYLRPRPADLADHLGKERHLSGIGLFPFETLLETSDLPSPRLFPLGQAQNPPTLWAHDGLLPLAPFLTHQTVSKTEG